MGFSCQTVCPAPSQCLALQWQEGFPNNGGNQGMPPGDAQSAVSRDKKGAGQAFMQRSDKLGVGEPCRSHHKVGVRLAND